MTDCNHMPPKLLKCQACLESEIERSQTEITELRNCGVTLDSTKRVKLALEKAARIAATMDQDIFDSMGKGCRIAVAIRAMAKEVRDDPFGSDKLAGGRPDY